MTIQKIITDLKLECVTSSDNLKTEISGCYTSDLLSDVIANAKKDYIWITLQTHINIIAVAKLKELAAIIIVKDKEIDKDTLDKANEENIVLLKSDLNAYKVSGKLYEIGLR